MVHKEISYFNLKAYKLGRFNDAINTTVHFFALGNIFIDSAQPIMKNVFDKISSSLKPDYCLLSHYHEDHSGNAAYLKRKFRTTIFSHKKSAHYLENGYKMLPYEKIIWGVPEKFSPNHFYENRLNLGKYLFKVIYTPGHSEDSVCLLEVNRGWLFTGDLFISSKPKYFTKDESIFETINSLNKLLKFDFEALFCAHRGIVTRNPKELLKNKKDYLEKTIETILELYKKGNSLKQIRNQLLGKENFVSFVTFFDFCKLNFVKTTIKEFANKR